LAAITDRLAIDGGEPVIQEPIPSGVHGPSAIDHREIEAVTRVLRSRKLFRYCEGSYVRRFEESAAKMLGVNHALMLNSGTSALICGLMGAGVAHNVGFPDRHIYRYWDSILDKNSANAVGYPWADPHYQGNVQYSRDMLPQTLDLLSRALRFGFNLNMTEDHARPMAQAMNKVDRALG
jgi:dTDP-4-amino-4,6-dideoxygalactose transaminase